MKKGTKKEKRKKERGNPHRPPLLAPRSAHARCCSALPCFVCRCEEPDGSPERVSPAERPGPGPVGAPVPSFLSPRSSGSPRRVSAAAEGAFEGRRPGERSVDHRRVGAVFVVPDAHFRSDFHNKSPDSSVS